MVTRLPLAAAALAACFLACLSPAARAAGGEETMEVRSYAVADLIVPLDQGVSLPTPGADRDGAKGAPPPTLEGRLIKLIVRAVEPASWEDNGGAATIDYYPLGMTLVIRQRPPNHERIAALLADLRKAQNMQVALEVRFLTVPEGFLERLGLDPGKQGSPAAVVRTTGGDGRERVGVDFEDSSRPNRQPGGPGQTFLNDRQVGQLLEAVQGDQRSTVLQAPKVTLANGQAATVSLTDSQFFLTGVDVVRSGEQATVRPRNEPVTTGFRMTARPVVSADRRFVQLFLKVEQTDLASAAVPMMPVPVEGGKGKAASTQYLQQPALTTLSVEKAVAVPDGGTVLFGGLRRVTESRTDDGPPVLSKIPYVSRCFRNVGSGRESQVVLVLATPRIIVNEEEVQAGTAAPCPPPATTRATTAQEEVTASARTANVLATLLRAYDEACAEGRADEAKKLAEAALALDPTCFRGKP